MIRRATANDAEAIYRLEREAFPNGSWTREAIENEFKDNPLSESYVDIEDEEVVAWLDFMITFNSATVMSLAVKPSYRRKGIATALMLLMEGRCREEKEEPVEWITLEVRAGNEGAIALYEKLGYRYVTTKKAYYENGEDALYMIRSLIS